MAEVLNEMDTCESGFKRLRASMCDSLFDIRRKARPDSNGYAPLIIDSLGLSEDVINDFERNLQEATVNESFKEWKEPLKNFHTSLSLHAAEYRTRAIASFEKAKARFALVNLIRCVKCQVGNNLEIMNHIETSLGEHLKGIEMAIASYLQAYYTHFEAQHTNRWKYFAWQTLESAPVTVRNVFSAELRKILNAYNEKIVSIRGIVCPTLFP